MSLHVDEPLMWPRTACSIVNFKEYCVSITQYSSTVCIGIAMVFVFSPYIRKFSSCFLFRLLITLQHKTCQNKQCMKYFTKIPLPLPIGAIFPITVVPIHIKL